MAYENLAWTLQAQGKPEEAIGAYREAIRLKPDDADAYANLGDTLNQEGKLEEAIAAYRAAIRLQPDFADAHNNLGNMMANQGKLDEAVAEYRESIRIQPNMAAAHQGLGLALDEQGKTQEALVAFREALRLKPDDGATHNSLALTLARSPDRPRRDYDEALVQAQRAVELGPEKGNRYSALALAEYRLGHWTESLAAAERSTALQNGVDAFNGFLTALAHWQKGDKDQARTWFDKAVAWMRETQSPKNPLFRQLWTEAAELLGQPGPDAAGAGSPAAPAAE